LRPTRARADARAPRCRQVWAPGAKPPPSALPRVLACAAGGLVAVSLHSLLSPKVPEQVFQDPRWVASHSVLYKVLYMWAMGFAARNKYYFVWQWAEAACCAGGVGWAGFETEGPAAGTPRWDRCCNVQVLGVELAGTAAELPLSWNTRTGTWLRHYCYERLLAPPLCAPGFLALLITQAVSGVWHGVYAGYGLFFTGSTFMLHAAKTLYRYQRVLPPMLRAPSVVLHTLLSAFHLNYLAAAFIIVTLPGGIAAWKSVHYVGHISMIVRCGCGQAAYVRIALLRAHCTDARACCARRASASSARCCRHRGLGARRLQRASVRRAQRTAWCRSAVSVCDSAKLAAGSV
jgi:lysophospholipid acyltransferase